MLRPSHFCSRVWQITLICIDISGLGNRVLLVTVSLIRKSLDINDNLINGHCRMFMPRVWWLTIRCTNKFSYLGASHHRISIRCVAKCCCCSHLPLSVSCACIQLKSLAMLCCKNIFEDNYVCYLLFQTSLYGWQFLSFCYYDVYTLLLCIKISTSFNHSVMRLLQKKCKWHKTEAESWRMMMHWALYWAYCWGLLETVKLICQVMSCFSWVFISSVHKIYYSLETFTWTVTVDIEYQI